MKVPISGQVTDRREIANVLDVALSDHYGGGKWMKQFERGIAQYTRHRFGLMTNSGSSANLLALAALELPKGSKVLTCAVGFPTTVNPILQLGHVPVFIDANPRTLNAHGDIENIRVDAAIFAHTLGNPMFIPPTSYPVIEDCADALGGEINGKLVGQRGVMSTYSHYPAHHITTGEGGALLIDDPKLWRIAESYRDWGRDCWCAPGEDNTCGKRYAGDYDHKYTYSRIGWNLKPSDFQAAAGVAQLEQINMFTRKRRENWKYLHGNLQDLPIEIIEPSPNSNPSWFGFAFLTDRRNELARHLDKHQIGNRPVMGGNLLRQPAYKNIECVVIGDMKGANEIHERGLWVGCFHGLQREHLDRTIEVLHDFYA